MVSKSRIHTNYGTSWINSLCRYDSVQDNESANLKMEVLKNFETLSATVNVEEHYLAADAQPKKHSIAGKRRLEFESFLSDLMLGHPS